jgi:hypothetical protein
MRRFNKCFLGSKAGGQSADALWPYARVNQLLLGKEAHQHLGMTPNHALQAIHRGDVNAHAMH